MAPVCRLHHRGFSLTLCASRTVDGFAYGFRLAHHGQRLYTSAPAHATLAGADRAGRRFVDDALHAYAWADEQLDTSGPSRPVYSSSK